MELTLMASAIEVATVTDMVTLADINANLEIIKYAAALFIGLVAVIGIVGLVVMICDIFKHLILP